MESNHDPSNLIGVEFIIIKFQTIVLVAYTKKMIRLQVSMFYLKENQKQEIQMIMVSEP